MPNKYERKSASRGQWSQEDLEGAIDAINTRNLSVRQASKDYGIPRKTLERRVKQNNSTKGRMGPDSLFGKEHEERIVKLIKKMQGRGFPLTRDDIRHIAYKFANQLKIKHKFNNEKEKAGYVWLQLFLSRHPDISVRKSENLSIARAKSMKRIEIQNYFDLLQSVLEENNLLGSPMNIFNMDETGLQLNTRPDKVLAAKGSRGVCSISSSEKGETISVIACCNAEGVFLPPTCIMKGKNKKKEWEDDMPPGATLFMNQKSAYVNSDIFYTWLRQVFVPRKPAGKTLLILDGHASHSGSVEMLEYAESKEVVILCLPSHTTHYLQPLDRAVCKSLKHTFYESCRIWTKNHPGRRLTRYQFGYLLSQCWGKSMTPQNAISGFKATGIFPFNPHAIPDYAFTVSDHIETNTNKEKDKTEDGQDVDINEDKENINVSEDVNQTDEPVNNEVIQPSTSKTLTAAEMATEENVVEETPTKFLEQISPVPAIAIEMVKKRAKAVASVLTSPENIQLCKVKILKKTEKKTKASISKLLNVGEQTKREKRKKTQNFEKIGKKVNKKKKIENETSSSAEEVPYDDSSDGDSVDEELCLICGERGKSETWFRCVSCGGWVHQLCSGATSAKGYSCDFC